MQSGMTCCRHSVVLGHREAPRPCARMPLHRTALNQHWSVRVRAEPPKERDVGSGISEKKIDEVIQELKKMGMTTQKARQILKTWADAGVKDDPDALRKLLVSKSLAPIPQLALQSGLDALAAFGGFYLADLASKGEDFPFRIGVEILGYAFGLYSFTQVLLGLSVVAGLLVTTVKYGSNSVQLLAAVQAVAGTTASGVPIVDKAARAANVFKVLSTLDAVAALLRDMYANPPTGDSLRNLGAYLTLAQAKEVAGFKPEAYGLSEREAGNIAYAFSTFDLNQNYRLEPNELGELCASLGKELDAAEVKEAVKLLDSNGNGWIDFSEFVAWWVKQTPPSTAAREQTEAASSGGA